MLPEPLPSLLRVCWLACQHQNHPSEGSLLRPCAEAAWCACCLQAWMRARGQSGMKTFTTDDVVDQFGVVKGTYEAVPLPKIKAYTVWENELCPY